MSDRTDSKRTYAIAAVVIGFFVIGLLAMLLTGYLSGGQPRTQPEVTPDSSPATSAVGATVASGPGW